MALLISGLLWALPLSVAIAKEQVAGQHEALFDRPERIAQAVDFWRRIYANVDTQSGFIHDNRHPEVVYEFYPLDAGDTPKRQQKDINRRVKQYQALLRDMAQRPAKQYNSEQQRVLALWQGQRREQGGQLSPEQFLLAAKRVRFQRGQADRFREGMAREKQYGPTVRRILKELDLPAELAALPHVESSYNPKVKSHAGALGMWQIMPATGRRYLKVNATVDERRDVTKSSRAAARLLKHNYKVMKSWPLAITAYNRGLAGVRRAVKAAGTRDIGEIVEHHEGGAFGFASRNFYAAFLAAYDVSSGRHRQQPSSRGSTQISLQRYLSSTALMEEFSVSSLMLKQWNPELGIRYWNGEMLLPPGQQLNLPSAALAPGAEAALRSLEALLGQDYQLAERFYRIQKGDKLSLLARNFGTDMRQLMDMNGVRSVHRIYAGQILELPYASLPLPARAATAAVSFASISTQPAAVPDIAADAEHVEIIRGLMTNGVLRDHSASRRLHRYAYEAMSLSQPSPWDTRVAAAIPNLAAVPDALRRASDSDTLLAGLSEYTGIDPALQADPADYLVSDDNTIEIQAGETLGHYAHWLDMSSRQLRKINRMGRRQPVVVGRRVQMDFSLVDRAEFEQRRRDYHAAQQTQYFARYQITGVREHALARGDNLWELANSEYAIPLWLLRQYNPDVNFDSVLSLNANLAIPVVAEKTG